MFLEYVKDLPQILYMVRALRAFDDHIINIHFNHFPQLLCEHLGHHSLVSGSCDL